MNGMASETPRVPSPYLQNPESCLLYQSADLPNTSRTDVYNVGNAGRADPNRESNSRNSKAANFVYDVTDLITPYDYSLGSPNTVGIAKRYQQRYERDPLSEIIGYPDYLWELQKLRDVDMHKFKLPNANLVSLDEYLRPQKIRRDILC